MEVDQKPVDSPIKSERYLWLICVEVVSGYARDGLDVSVVIMQHFFIEFDRIRHVI